MPRARTVSFYMLASHVRRRQVSRTRTYATFHCCSHLDVHVSSPALASISPSVTHVMCEADLVIGSHAISQQILKIVEEFVIVVSRFLDCVYIRL